MISKADALLNTYAKKDLPEIRPGDNIRVHLKIKEGKKEKIQIFEGKVLAIKHNKEIGGTITVRKVIDGVGVEKIFPIYSPAIAKIEVLERFKTKRAKLYFMREAKGKRARMKKGEIGQEARTEETATENETAEKEQKNEQN